MKTQCPHCQAYFNIKPDYVGKRTKCKNCGRGFLIAEAAEIQTVASPSTPARISNFVSASSLTRALAEKKAGELADTAIAEEAGGGAEARASVEKPAQIPEIQFKAEDQTLTVQETQDATEKAADTSVVQSTTEDAADGSVAKPIVEEPVEIQEIHFKTEVEHAPEQIEPAVRQETDSFGPTLDSLGVDYRSAISIAPPEVPKPPAVQAQINEALKSSRPSVPPNPIHNAALPAFQPMSTVQATGYAQPAPEWGLTASLEAGHQGTGLSGSPSSSPSFQSIGFSVTGGGYGGGASPFPAGAGPYPIPTQPDSPGSPRPNIPPKNGQGEVPRPPFPPNGGGAVPGNGGAQPAVSVHSSYGQPSGPRPKLTERNEYKPADYNDAEESLIKRYLKLVPRAIWITMAVAFVFGGIIGAKMNTLSGRAEMLSLRASVSQAQQQLQTRQDDKVAGLKKERQRLNEDLRRVSSYTLDYPEGSIPRALAQAASEEFKIADTLLLQQIAAIESGAKVNMTVNQTKPDPELAATLEAEMIKMEEEIARQWQEAKDLEETPKMLATTSIATQMVSLAILNRNLLIARYGLSSPVPLQYRSPGPQGPAAASSAPLSGEQQTARGTEAQAPAELERLKKENERLQAENEMLLNSDSTIYASAISDMGSGHLIAAEEKFKRLMQMFPTSPLAIKAKEGLDELKVKVAEKETAKHPPVEITAIGVKHDGGYFRNQTYVRVSFKNISQLMIKRLEFEVLTFDEHGYPIASKRLDITQDNFFTAAMTENIAPGRGDYGVWELSEKVRQVKVKLKTVEFYDIPPWRDEDIEFWVEKEGGRYQVDKKGKSK